MVSLDPMAVSVTRARGGGLVIAVGYSYEKRPATPRQRAGMAKAMLHEALGRLQEGEPVDLGFGEDGLRCVRTDRIEARSVRGGPAAVPPMPCACTEKAV